MGWNLQMLNLILLLNTMLILMEKILAKLKIQFHGLRLLAGIFPSTSLQPVNGSKNSILNWVMKLSLFIEVFSFFVFKTTLKDFPFYSSILFTLWFRYLPSHIKESCIYLSSQLFLKTPNYEIPRKVKEKCISKQPADQNFKNFPFSVYHGATPWSHWTMQRVKKLNLCGKTTVDKSTWIKA